MLRTLRVKNLAIVENFVVSEKGKRLGMLAKHPDNLTYWQARVDEATRAEQAVAEVWKAMP